MTSGKKKNSNKNPFLDLTWIDIQEWAGSKILSRGKSYQRCGSVSELGITGKNELVAWVDGSTRYATKAGFKGGNLSSNCTCPYGTDCKHGVAVVIEYLESLKQKRNIPVILQSDKRILLLKQGKTAWPDESDNNFDEEFDDDIENNYSELRKRSGKKSENSIDDFLKNKSQEELVAIVKELAASYPEVSTDLSFKAKLSSPSVTALVKTVSKEIDKATSEPGWSNHWENSGYTPDYSRVQAGLQKLFNAGRYDEIVTLGKKLYSKGMEQAGQSNDQGETIQEISDALSIVFLALSKSSLSNVEKIEQAIDWEMEDEYSISEGLETFWKTKFSKNDWSTIADRLLKRLKGFKTLSQTSELSRDYKRDKLTDNIINALDYAGRFQEKLDLCIQEAPLTKSYDRLVTMLRKSGKTVEAVEWIRKGIKATQDNLSGIASGLRKQLFEIYSQRHDWPFCAALKADDFFEHPSLSRYKELKQASEKAKVWKEIRAFIISFLNNGIRPKDGAKEWPLPETGISSPSRGGYSKPPFTTELIEIALFEKDIDEALRLYDQEAQKHKRSSSFGYGWSNSISDKIADAVKIKYPQRSIGIWKTAAESHIAQTNPKEYAIALGYLNRILKVMKTTGKEEEFKKYIALIRAQNVRKIRLVEMLDSLTGRKIVDE